MYVARRGSPVEATASQESRERGSTLIISLGMLALLAVFALTFARLVNFERRAAVNYTDTVRARMVAKAGIQRAVAELQGAAQRAHYSNLRSPTNPGGEHWGYALTAPLPEADMERLELPLDLLTTLTPSLRNDPGLDLQDPNRSVFLPDPGTDSGFEDFRHLGKHLAVSGELGRSYADGLDAYKLKILDAASQVNLNHPDRLAARRMLKNLLLACSEFETAWNLQPAEAEDIARQVLELPPVRPGGEPVRRRFSNKTEVGWLLAPLIDQQADPDQNRPEILRWAHGFKDPGSNYPRPPLRDLITVSSWEDEKVIRPWALNSGDDLPAADREPTRQQLELVQPGRAPINLNTASFPVLVALFAELEARNRFGRFKLSYRSAIKLARLILERRGEEGAFKSWVEFETWLDGIEGNTSPFFSDRDGNQVVLAQRQTGPGNLDAMIPAAEYRRVSPLLVALDGDFCQGLRDLVKASLNPNTMLNKFGQAANHGGTFVNGMPYPRLVDKADLISMTTEGCFDAMGVFEITSLGLILQRDLRAGQRLVELGLNLDEEEQAAECRVIAAHSERVVLRIYDVLRLTNQVDFEENRMLFAEGDFIPDYKHWFRGLGYNRANEQIEEFSGWPSLVSNPTYSLVRGDSVLHRLAEGYTPADYDGSLTLSNLQGKRTYWMDFVAGFARGTTDAFKVRAWWFPKDQEPYTEGSRRGGRGIHETFPSRPEKAYPAPWQNLGGLTRQEWQAQEEGTWPQAPDYRDLRLLAEAMPIAGEGIRYFDGTNAVDADPFPADPEVEDVDDGFWDSGSSLLNTGVAISPLRNQDARGRPTTLAYNGDNLELTKGCSIRFWVMPTVDPYLRDEEVLFSFIGSNGETDPAQHPARFSRRDVGFRVIKRATLGGVSIVLQACPGEDLIPTEDPPLPNSGAQPALGSIRWNANDGQSGDEDAPGVWTDQVSIDVTPRCTSGLQGSHHDPVSIAANGERPGSGAGRDAVDPFNPEWIPGTWHWIVINYGWTGRQKDSRSQSEHSEVILPMYDISLQVDLSPTQPPVGLTTDEVDPGRLAFLGEHFITQGYGELHGFDDPDEDREVPSDRGPLGYWTFSRNPLSRPRDPRMGENKVEFLNPRNGDFAVLFVYPRPFGDWYNCNLSGSAERVHKEFRLPNAFVESGGVIRARLNEVPFPLNSFDRRVYATVRARSPDLLPIWSDGEVGPPPGPDAPPAGEAPGDPPPPPTASPAIAAGQLLPLTPQGNGWVLELDEDVAEALAGAGGSDPDYVIDLVLNFSVLERTRRHRECWAKWTGTRWDGAAMQRWFEDHAQDPSRSDLLDYVNGSDPTGSPGGGSAGSGGAAWPPPATTDIPQWLSDFVNEPFRNGNYHDSAMTEINGIPFAAAEHTDDGRPVPSERSQVTFACQLDLGNARDRGDLPLPPDYLRVPAIFMADDCHGCEHCDIDGPMWLGGEPAVLNNDEQRRYNQVPDGQGGWQLAPLEPETMAYAIFDNFMVLNSVDRRTDYRIVNGPIVDWYEDRFFETSAVSGYFEQELRDPSDDSDLELPDAAFNFGAVYRRAFLELMNSRRRLASLTWTSYPSSDGQLTYDVTLTQLPGEGPGEDPRWNFDNKEIALLPRELEPESGIRRWDLVDGNDISPAWNHEFPEHILNASPPPFPIPQPIPFQDGVVRGEGGEPVGYGFGPHAFYDGVTQFDVDGEKLRGSDLLFLTIQLRGLTTPYRRGDTGEEVVLEDASGNEISGVPAPPLLAKDPGNPTAGGQPQVVLVSNEHAPWLCPGDDCPRTDLVPAENTVCMECGAFRPADYGQVAWGNLPTPVLETPVFEDLTLNVFCPTPRVLETEEGAIE